MTSAICAKVYVVERIFAADKWCVEQPRGLMAPASRLHQGAQCFSYKWISPAKIVEQGNPFGVRAGDDCVAYGFIHNSPCHSPGIALAIFGVNSVGQHNAFSPFGSDRFQNGGIRWCIRVDTRQRPDHRSSLNLVIVDADDWSFAGDVS